MIGKLLYEIDPINDAIPINPTIADILAAIIVRMPAAIGKPVSFFDGVGVDGSASSVPQ